MSQFSSEAQTQLNLFKRQYLQVIELDLLAFPESSFLRDAEFQRSLYDEIFKQESMSYPSPDRYRMRTLKALIAKIEGSILDPDEDEVSSDLMSSFASLLTEPLLSDSASALQKSYVTYTLPLPLVSLDKSAPTLTLLESRALISGSGTTGLRTWEAALNLGTFLTSCEGRKLIYGKKVLELGAGTGFLSILCAKHLGATKTLATDGDEVVLEGLKTNMFLNGMDGRGQIIARPLKWGRALTKDDFSDGGELQEWNIVLGADLIYDSTAFPPLVSSLGDIFRLFPRIQVIMSATVRNEQTFESFRSACGPLCKRSVAPLHNSLRVEVQALLNSPLSKENSEMPDRSSQRSSRSQASSRSPRASVSRYRPGNEENNMSVAPPMFVSVAPTSDRVNLQGLAASLESPPPSYSTVNSAQPQRLPHAAVARLRDGGREGRSNPPQSTPRTNSPSAQREEVAPPRSTAIAPSRATQLEANDHGLWDSTEDDRSHGPVRRLESSSVGQRQDSQDSHSRSYTSSRWARTYDPPQSNAPAGQLHPSHSRRGGPGPHLEALSRSQTSIIVPDLNAPARRVRAQSQWYDPSRRPRPSSGAAEGPRVYHIEGQEDVSNAAGGVAEKKNVIYQYIQPCEKPDGGAQLLQTIHERATFVRDESFSPLILFQRAFNGGMVRKIVENDNGYSYWVVEGMLWDVAWACAQQGWWVLGFGVGHDKGVLVMEEKEGRGSASGAALDLPFM
ncbi:MAG: hypothetical protein M1837_000571 [Sclerophora amabilis]|nr:MAG: hypothetical protein M1837_000571 [Sclerophora amabilis]